MDRERSVVFDRIADEYDATRGGEERGRRYAPILAAQLPAAARVLEVGAGTGIIARAMRDAGVDVVGVDLSPAMLRLAVARIGSRVAVGDAHRLPVRDAAVDAAYCVWLLHLVADVRGVLAEMWRVIRPGGRLLVCTAAEDGRSSTDLDALMKRLGDVLGYGPARVADRPDRVTALATELGFVAAGRHQLEDRHRAVPAEWIGNVERRVYSMLWDLDDATWAGLVQPVIDEARALPNVQAGRETYVFRPVLVFERP